MDWYCKKCTRKHTGDEMCPEIRKELKKHPEWLIEAQEFLVKDNNEKVLYDSGILDNLSGDVISGQGMFLASEKAHIAARDIEVFQRLNEERYPRKGCFSSAKAAKDFLENATDSQKTNLKTNLNGMGQEVDYLRHENHSIRGLILKTELLTDNAEGVDTITKSRLNGRIVDRTSVKAAGTNGGMNTNAQGVIDALDKGTLKTNESVNGNEGFKNILYKKLDKRIKYEEKNGNVDKANIFKEAKENLKITEQGTKRSVNKSSERLTKKMQKGNVNLNITGKTVLLEAGKGAVVGAAIGLTVSALTSFIRYKLHEISLKDAIRDIAEETIKSTLVGAALGTLALFTPAGPVGFVIGVVVGVYLNSVLTNILDEVFGKGAYREILDTQGYMYAMFDNMKKEFALVRENHEKYDDINGKCYEKRTAIESLID